MSRTAALCRAFLSLLFCCAIATPPARAGASRRPTPEVVAVDLRAPDPPDFRALAAEQAEGAVEARRWLHAHAELSMREVRTQAWLRKELSDIPGVELLEGDWKTGVVAILGGALDGPLVAYRADFDALPLREETGLPFACAATDTLGGRTVGVMHACGHDLHAAILLGTVRALSRIRGRMKGSLLLVLEPGEEIGAGAATLVEGGVFRVAGKPAAIYALHDHPTFLPGQVGYCPGHSAANVDDFYIRVVGHGGHGAYPHTAIDPVLTASRIVVALQSIVSREIDSARQAVITVGSIHGGTSSNVIPDYVDLRGTARSLEPEVREQLHDAIVRTASGVAAASGAPEPQIRYAFGTPSMYNDPKLVEETLPVLRADLGDSNVVLYPPGMGGEDFSIYQAEVPGFMFRLGVGRPDRPMNVHSAAFDPDEAAIPIGVRLMCEVLWDRLSRPSRP